MTAPTAAPYTWETYREELFKVTAELDVLGRGVSDVLALFQDASNINPDEPPVERFKYGGP